MTGEFVGTEVQQAWEVLRRKEVAPPWTCEEASRFVSYAPVLHSGMFGEDLAAAYGFFFGHKFEGSVTAAVAEVRQAFLEYAAEEGER